MDLTSTVSTLAAWFKPVTTDWSRDRLVIRQNLMAYAKAVLIVMTPFLLFAMFLSGFTVEKVLVTALILALCWWLVSAASRRITRTITIDKKRKALIMEEAILFRAKPVKMSLEGFKCISFEEISRNTKTGRADVTVVVTTKTETKDILKTGEGDASEIVSAMNSSLFDDDVTLVADETPKNPA